MRPVVARELILSFHVEEEIVYCMQRHPPAAEFTTISCPRGLRCSDLSIPVPIPARSSSPGK